MNPYNHEAVQQFEANGRDHEQIYGGNVRRVVSQKGPPSLTWRSASLDDVLGDARNSISIRGRPPASSISNAKSDESRPDAIAPAFQVGQL
jgi:hypothetical protein